MVAAGFFFICSVCAFRPPPLSHPVLPRHPPIRRGGGYGFGCGGWPIWASRRIAWIADSARALLGGPAGVAIRRAVASLLHGIDTG
jgi:hypothetical protein